MTSLNHSDVRVSQWSVLSPHQLFNKLNNLVSQLILDFRSRERFDALRIKESQYVSSELEEDLAALIKIALHSRHKQTTYVEIVVLLPSSEFPQQIQQTLLASIAEEGGQIIENESAHNDLPTTDYKYTCTLSYILDADETFFARYQQCSFFMDSINVIQAISGTTKTYANEILPGFLFLGDCSNAVDVDQHTALGITHIVEATHSRISKTIAKHHNIQHLEIKIWDYEGASIADHFDQVHTFLESAKETGGKVLVHCKAGISRSSTLIMSYLLKYCPAMTLQDIVKHVVTARPVVCPNDGFQMQLIEYEKVLRNENSIVDLDAFAAAVQESAKLWCKFDTVDSAYEKIPINAWRALKAQTFIELEQDTTLVENNRGPAKPVKPFLKRGEGKKSAREQREAKPQTDEQQKPKLSEFVKELRTKVKSSKENADETISFFVGSHSDDACDA